MAGEQRIDWTRGVPKDSIQEYLLWLSAVEQAERGEMQPLIALLRSGRIPGPESRELIADLLSRHNLSGKRGRQATPFYKATKAEARLANQQALVRYFQRKGEDAPTAMKLALREAKRDEISLRKDVRHYTDEQLDEMISEDEQNALENLVYGRRGSTRRMQKRRTG
jgi:hypothetical protein